MGMNVKSGKSKISETFMAHVRPQARRDDLIIEEVADELLIYDLDGKNAHCLTPTAARVWQLCDGDTTPAVIATKLGLEPDAVASAVEQLDASGLLVEVPGTGSTRREFGLKVAAGAATLPLVLSIAAPAAAQSNSVVVHCFNKTGPEGTNNCNICNEPTGNNTLCCCCHKPQFLPPVEDGGPGGNFTNPPNKLCSPEGTYCEAVLGGSHCTEDNNP